MSAPGKEAVAAALGRARAFLAERGAECEALYVATLAGEAPRADFVARAAAVSQADGALASLLAGDARGGDAGSTADALGWLVPIGVTEGAPVDAAAAYLTGAQRADGGWDAPGGDEHEASLALSATLCGLLSRCPGARQSSLRRAAAFLAAHWSPDRVQRGSYPAIAGYLHAFATVPADVDEADTALQWCGRELERAYRIGAFGPAAVGDVFVRCDALAVPGARLDGAEIAVALLREQRPDGGFGPPGAELRATCKSALALRHLAAALR
jgi:hypothetical protein